MPELAIGRLVESPAQILAQIEAFGAASGRLDASSAYAAGYDFMVDGVDSVRTVSETSLASAHGASVSVSGPSQDPWSTADLLGDLAGPPAPSVSAIFGHADHTAFESAAGTEVTAAALAETLPDGARLVFSMGCHSGLAVSDRTVGGGAAADDLAAALTARGAAYVATTGYGYGDQVSIGLQERLMTLFAAQLDGAVSLGDALRNAKQQYFGSQGLYGAYDEKRTVQHHPLRLADVRRRHRAADSADTCQRDGVPDPGDPAGLSSVPYSEDFTFPPAQTSDIGQWFEADAGSGPQLPQITAGRPVQPRSEARRDGRGGRQPPCYLRTGRWSAVCRRETSSRTSTRRSVVPRSTTLRANRKQSTPSRRSRHGWQASRRRATVRVSSGPTGLRNARNWC